MAKRYHQSKKARHNEHMGMEAYERGPVKYAEPYANREISKRMMREDGHMIHSDPYERSNLPQQVMQKEWPRAYNHLQDYYVEDLFLGVNKQLNEDGEGMKKAFGPRKY